MNKRIYLALIALLLSLVSFIFSLIIFIDKNKTLEVKESSEPVIVSTPEIKTETETATEPEKEKQIFLLTAYCPCFECSEGYGDITATGRRAVEGRTIAVDPDVIEYGTTVYIDGIGARIAEDCGGLVKGNHIDIYFDCHSKVNAFGKRYEEVEICTI